MLCLNRRRPLTRQSARDGFKTGYRGIKRMFNRMKAVVTFAAGAVAGLMLAACLTVQGSRPGVFGGEALILPLLALLLYVGYEAGRLSTLAQAEQRRRKRRAGPPYRVEQKTE